MTKARWPGVRFVPGLLLAMSLTCKESALVFAAGLVVLEAQAARRAEPEVWRERALLRSWPVFLVCGVYLALRIRAFGLAPEYRDEGLGSYFDSDLLGLFRPDVLNPHGDGRTRGMA